LVTGIPPRPDLFLRGGAWNVLHVLNRDVSAGWFIRALHGWGSNFMVAIVLIHHGAGLSLGAYKYPRELTWVVGVPPPSVTLGMAFTGRCSGSIRTRTGAWESALPSPAGFRLSGTRSSISCSAVPIIAGATLSRFFALHVFRRPGL